MGLPVFIYRSELPDCSNGGLSSRVQELTLINLDGPFEPTEERPPARLVRREIGGREVFHVEPAERPAGMVGPMMGGCYVGTSDSRLGAATGVYGALALHDRFETFEQYASYD